MKRFVFLIMLVLFIFASANADEKQQWQQDYKLALDNLDKQDLISALYFIDKALNQKEEPALDLTGEDGKKWDYLPYYYLGIIYYKMGKYNLSLSSFDLSEKYSLVKQREILYDNLKKYRLFVNNKLILHLSETPPQFSKSDEVKLEAQKKYFADEYEETTNVSKEEFQKLKGREARLLYIVRKELGLPNEPIGIYPWYFYYERAVKYTEEGQWKEAMLYLSESLLRKHDPKKNARRYGVWFKDYTPYLYLAYAAWQLDNSTIAREAFQISQAYGVEDPGDPLFIKLKAALK